MPRRPRPLDPDSDPVHRFAQELREIHRRAGKPTRSAIARQMNCSHATVSHILNGDRFPSWDNVAAFINACSQDPEGTRNLWLEIDKELESHVTRQSSPRLAEDVSATRKSNEKSEKLASRLAELSTRVVKLNTDLSHRDRELNDLLAHGVKISSGIRRAIGRAYETDGTTGFIARLLQSLSSAVYPAGIAAIDHAHYHPLEREIVVHREMPLPRMLSDIAEYRLIEQRCEIVALPRGEDELREAYEKLIFDLSLRTVAEVFDATPRKLVERVSFAGVIADGPARNGPKVTVVALQLSFEVFEASLNRWPAENSMLMFMGMGGLASPDIYRGMPLTRTVEFDLSSFKFVDPVDFHRDVHGSLELLSLAPAEFEQLIRQLLQKMALRAYVTVPSADEGVDIVAVDDSSFFGGLYLVQAKRYSKVVGSEAVHALAGVMEAKGASKGIIITSSWFGSRSRAFAARHGRIELVDGSQLCSLLHQYLGITAHAPEPPPPRDTGTLGV